MASSDSTTAEAELDHHHAYITELEREVARLKALEADRAVAERQRQYCLEVLLLDLEQDILDTRTLLRYLQRRVLFIRRRHTNPAGVFVGAYD